MSDQRIGSLQAAEPDKGSAAFLFLKARKPADPPEDRRNTRDQGEQKEVKHMTISVLDGRKLTDNPLEPSLGTLHDQAGAVDDATLPCRVNNPELWFAESPTDVEYAKALCSDCPVRALCLDGALERREPWGVWGGQLFLQGVVIPRKRPRGRPRKNEAAA